MRPTRAFVALLLSAAGAVAGRPVLPPDARDARDRPTRDQRPLALDPTAAHPHESESPSDAVPLPLFASLERMSRLVDIAYCVGTTGILPPFACVSRCRDFPSLRLVKTWNTGVLMTDSCGYIAVDHGAPPLGAWTDGPAIIVAFRGTYSIANTVVDLSTVPQEYVPYPAPPGDGDDTHQPPRCDNCTVHAGFHASWLVARRLVLPAVKAAREKHPGYPVRLVGHSLGGAVAALAALEMRMSLGWGDDVQVTTFGEPRIGNSGLAVYVNSVFALADTKDRTNKNDQAYRRVTHIEDPVPLLPLTEWGFRPHAGEIFITKQELQPGPDDVRFCRGNSDPECIAGGENDDDDDGDEGDKNGARSWIGTIAKSLLGGEESLAEATHWAWRHRGIPAKFRLWQLLFAHRDYFWRLGLCVPGGDPSDWGRSRYEPTLGKGAPRDL